MKKCNSSGFAGFFVWFYLFVFNNGTATYFRDLWINFGEKKKEKIDLSYRN